MAGRSLPTGGGVLLREVDLRISLLGRLAGCFRDYRNPNSVEHSVRSLLAQRVYGLALGYEDVNDHDELRCDRLLALLVGKADLEGDGRVRARDRGVSAGRFEFVGPAGVGHGGVGSHGSLQAYCGRFQGDGSVAGGSVC